MTYRKRMITEREQRILDRVAARERKAREAAAARNAKLKALGYCTLTITVPEEVRTAVNAAIKDLVRDWIANHRQGELVSPESVDPLTQALKAAVANIDLANLGRMDSEGSAEEA